MRREAIFCHGFQRFLGCGESFRSARGALHIRMTRRSQGLPTGSVMRFIAEASLASSQRTFRV